MKTMTKIKLINWHIFDNHTVSIEKNTLITGENGHGKSTLLDAVSFVLSGASTKFNQAANTFGKRTVDSYVRGKIGMEGKEYLRDQDQLIGHVALEFYDEMAKKSMVIGVVLELPLPSKNNHGVFYHIADSELEEKFFIRDQKILGLNQLKAVVKAAGKEARTANTLTEIKNMLRNTLGLSGEKYFDLLPKALAFTPINDVNKFVYDFLLPEDTVDIEGLKTNIQSYRDVSQLLKTEKEKLTALTPLEELAGNRQKSLDAIAIMDYLVIDCQLEEVKDLLVTEKQNAREAEKKKNLILDDLNATDAEINRLNREIDDMENGDLPRRVKSLEQDIKAAEIKKKDLWDTITRMMHLLKEEQRLAEQVDLPYGALQIAERRDYSLLSAEIERYHSSIGCAITDTTVESRKVQEQLVSLRKQKSDNESLLGMLKAKRFFYPDYVEKLLDVLRTGLASEFNKTDIEVKPLCELIEIDQENEQWVNAVEGFLNTQKFDVIVEPKYFEKALELYEKNKFSKKIHGIGLVNTNKMIGFSAEPNSLATKVRGLNEFARQTINMIMGLTICVEDHRRLKDFDRSITPTGMTYRNHTARQINPESWSTPFIGLRALQKQLDQALADEKLIRKTFVASAEKASYCETRIRLMQSSAIKTLLNMPDHFGNLVATQNDFDRLIKELTLFKKNNAYFEAMGLLENKKKARDENQKHHDEMSRKIGVAEQRILDCHEKETNYENQIKSLMEEIGKYSTNDHILAEASERKVLLFETHGRDFIKIRTTIDKEKHSLSQLIVVSEAGILNLMTEYIRKYDNGQLLVDIRNLLEFTNLLAKIRDRNIIEFEDKAASALKVCEKSFKEDFLSKLRDKIQNAQAGFDLLNKSLKTKPFGSDQEIYTFKYVSSTNPVFKDYFAILQTLEDYEARSIFVDSLTEKNMRLLNDLFEILTADDKTEAHTKLIMEYTDYRKYMNYDIQITNKEGNTYFFSKVNKEKSGGETQTPFYVIIASSFQQIVDAGKRNRSSACVVMFDEAFNNMDESRIEAMMGYYRELNIQLLIAVPPQRIVNIIPYVNTTLGLVKANNTVVIQYYRNYLPEMKNNVI